MFGVPGLVSVGKEEESEKNSSSVIDVEALLRETENFIRNVKDKASQAHRSRLSMFRRASTAEEMLNVFENVQIKILDVESKLRDAVTEAAEKKSALNDQAQYLSDRLNSCINSNLEYYNKQQEIFGKLKIVINDLSEEGSSLKAMLSFNENILKQKKAQCQKEGADFSSWLDDSNGEDGNDQDNNSNLEHKEESSMENGKKKTLSQAAVDMLFSGMGSYSFIKMKEEELKKDKQHDDLSQKLQKIRDSREKLVSCLSKILESINETNEDLENSRIHKKALQDVLHGDGYSLMPETETTFNHADCHDCLAVCEMSKVCSEHYSRVASHVAEMTKRLSTVVEIRERVKDIWTAQREDDIRNHPAYEKDKNEAVTIKDEDGAQIEEVDKEEKKFEDGYQVEKN